MILTVQAAITARTSVNHFAPDRPLDDATIATLVDQATKAPSAFNLQNWRFIAVRSEEAKARLKSAAYGQQKIVDGSTAFIVCGTLAAHQQLASALAPSVAAGFMAAAMAEGWTRQAHQSHENNPVLQRDEAVRSASLAAMTLMLAAQGMGLDSCAMSGFDAGQVAQQFDLSATELPVMIVVVGHATADNWPQKPRKAVSDVLTIV